MWSVSSAELYEWKIRGTEQEDGRRVEMVFGTSSLEMEGQSFVISISEAVTILPIYPGAQIHRKSIALFVHILYVLPLPWLPSSRVWGQAHDVPWLVLRDKAVCQKTQLLRDLDTAAAAAAGTGSLGSHGNRDTQRILL